MAAEAEQDRLELLGQVAAWYYEDDLDQSEIARRIGRSRSMVSRLLKEARDRGLVEIRVRFPLRTEDGLEQTLVGAFGLAEARVLAGSQADDEAMLRRVGRLAARAMQARLHSTMDIAIGWGAALHHTVRAMPEMRLDDVMVVQAMGTVGDGDPNVDGADLARSLASKLMGDFRTLAAPLIVDREDVAASLLAERTIATTIEMAKAAELTVIGIGSIDSSLSGLVRAGYFAEGQLAHLRSLGVVGDVMGYLVDAAGTVLDISENRRVVALRPDQLAGTVIGVAGGTAKAGAIHAALRAGYLDVLVTDRSAAESVLAMHRTEVSGLVEV